MSSHARTGSGLRAAASEFRPGSGSTPDVVSRGNEEKEVPERWDDGLEEYEEKAQEKPTPTAPKQMQEAAMKKSSRRRSDLQRLSVSSTRRSTLESFTFQPAPGDRTLEAIANNPDLTKRQKKRHSKKYRNYLKDSVAEYEPELQVFNVSEDDFPPLGTTPPSSMKRVISSSAASASASPSTPVAIIARPRRGTIPTGPALMSSAPGPSHHKSGSSTSWVSSATGLRDKYERLTKNAGHFNLLASPFFPQNVGEYANHLTDVKREKIEREQAKIEYKLEEREKAKKRPDVVEIEVLVEEQDGLLGCRTVGLEKGWSAAYDKYIALDTKDEHMSTANPAEEFHALEPMRMRVEREHFVTVVDDRTGDQRTEESVIWKEKYLGVRRAAWPEQNELKAEGEMRLRAGGERRMPLPRLAQYTKDAYVHKFQNGATAEELRQAKGDDILWYEREPVSFGGVDLLDCIATERDSNEKIWDHTGLLSQSRWPAIFASGVTPERRTSRGMSSVAAQCLGRSNTPGHEMDGLTRHFASMGSHGFADQVRADAEAVSQRAVSGPAAYGTPISGYTPKLNARGTGPWIDRRYSTDYHPISQTYRAAHPFGGRTSRASNHTAPVHRTPYTPSLSSAPYSPSTYTDVFEDDQELPPGGFQLDGETLRHLGVADFLHQM